MLYLEQRRRLHPHRVALLNKSKSWQIEGNMVLRHLLSAVEISAQQMWSGEIPHHGKDQMKRFWLFTLFLTCQLKQGSFHSDTVEQGIPKQPPYLPLRRGVVLEFGPQAY
jgi:hypothetical protein